jgi:hypothetical protein
MEWEAIQSIYGDSAKPLVICSPENMGVSNSGSNCNDSSKSASVRKVGHIYVTPSSNNLVLSMQSYQFVLEPSFPTLKLSFIYCNTSNDDGNNYDESDLDLVDVLVSFNCADLVNFTSPQDQPYISSDSLTSPPLSLRSSRASNQSIKGNSISFQKNSTKRNVGAQTNFVLDWFNWIKTTVERLSPSTILSSSSLTSSSISASSINLDFSAFSIIDWVVNDSISFFSDIERNQDQQITIIRLKSRVLPLIYRSTDMEQTSVVKVNPCKGFVDPSSESLQFMTNNQDLVKSSF